MTQETIEASENQTSEAQTKARLRNRLVGSIILFAAAIIIIPSILDGRKLSYKDDFKNVPPRDEFRSVQSAKPFPAKSFDQQMPQSDEEVTDEVPVDADELVNAAQEAPKQQTKEVLNNETIAVNTLSRPVNFDDPGGAQAMAAAKAQSSGAQPKATKESPFSDNAWVIQLGVFGRKSNVVALEKKLNDAGFATFSRDIKARNGRTLTKVFVGPELNKETLAKNLSQVNKVSGLNGKIAPYSVKK